MILDSKKIPYEKLDVAASEEHKERMRQLSGNPKALPPQLFNDDQYCGVSKQCHVETFTVRLNVTTVMIAGLRGIWRSHWKWRVGGILEVVETWRSSKVFHSDDISCFSFTNVSNVGITVVHVHASVPNYWGSKFELYQHKSNLIVYSNARLAIVSHVVSKDLYVLGYK